jgi:hypothetical protein
MMVLVELMFDTRGEKEAGREETAGQLHSGLVEGSDFSLYVPSLNRL